MSGVGWLRVFCFSLVLHTVATTQAAVILTKTDSGFDFTEAMSLSVNGKDKVLAVGPSAELRTAPGKLPGLKLGGTLFKDLKTQVLVDASEGTLVFTMPEGAGKGGTGSVAEMWTRATITYKTSKADKSPTPLAFSKFLAFLPEGTEELARLCADRQKIALIGGQENVFSTQLKLIEETAKRFPADSSLSVLQTLVSAAMHERVERIENGTAREETFKEAMRLRELSSELYPQAAPQAKLRDEIAASQAQLDLKIAVMKAFAAGKEWDSFILASRGSERFEAAFPELVKLRTTALEASLEVHQTTAEEMAKEREFEAAYREFRKALSRRPSDRMLQQKVLMSWTDYSREVALDNQRNRKQLGEGEREILNQAIQFATNYKNEQKLDLAFKSISEAESIDPTSLPMLLKKAEILGARGELTQAVLTLDEYDLHAVNEERVKGSELRNELLFKQKSSIEEAKQQARSSFAAGEYQQSLQAALNGLRADDRDPDLLYQAGVSSIVTRNPKQAREFFNRYVEIATSLDADPELRGKARALLSGLQDEKEDRTGQPNWFSGKRLPPDVFYDPISLSFQPRIDHVEASNKMHVQYEWVQDRLTSIAPRFEKADHTTRESKISFVYSEGGGQVSSAFEGDTPPASDQSNKATGSSKLPVVIIANNPSIDPIAIAKLTGKNITLGISGNRYFEPFVWEKIHYFRFTYDANGRIQTASELLNPSGTPGGLTLEMEWSGSQLMAIRGFEGSKEHRGGQIYERALHYDGGRLISEEIHSSGKSAQIKYSYNGPRLVSATCTNDETLDARSRQVSFR